MSPPPPPYLPAGAGGWSVPGVTGVGDGAAGELPVASTVVTDVQAALSAAAAVDPVTLPGPQALADTAGLLAARDQLDRLLLARIGDVDARQLATLSGSATTSSWLAAAAPDLPAGTAATARRLTVHPALAAAVADGTVGPRAAEHLGRTLAQLRRHLDGPDGLIDGQDAQPVLAAVVVDGVLDCLAEAYGSLPDDSPRLAVLHELEAELSEIAWQVQASQLDRLERALVLLAGHLPARWLPPALARLTGALLPSRLEDDADRVDRERRLVLTPDRDGGGHVRGRLTAEAYELFHTALSAAAATDPANPTDTAGWCAAREQGWQSGDPLPDTPVVRTRPQRQHDALVLGLRALLDSAALGSRGKAVPHIAVTVPLGALHRAPGAMPARGASGALLPLSLVSRWMRDSAVTRFVLDLTHRVVETSHTQRTLTAAERRTKLVETGGACQSATCPAGPHPPPGTALVPHHPEAWARTGTTSVSDAVLFCAYDHTQLHRGAVITLRDGRRLSEDGWLP